MNRRVRVLLVALLGLGGCLQPQTRMQSAEEGDRDREAEVKTVGEITAVANADGVQLSGVGLVVRLDGTGGGLPPPSGFRSLLEGQLRQHAVDNVKEVLSDPNHALVLVSATIPAGARKGDPLDIEVTLPPGSKTTSLRGGVLRETVLFNYESTKQLNPNYAGGNRPLLGHPLAKASGTVLAGLGDGDEAAQLRQGRIWGGGRCAIDRPFYLTLNPEQQFSRTAMRVAERVNHTFQGTYPGPNSSLAEAKTKEVVYLQVPPQYRLNLPRFLRVVRLVPLQETPPSSHYQKKLAEDLLDPAKTVTAALRLEALGTGTIPALKAGLKSDHALVRFTSAEALAYQGDAACAEELARLVLGQPALRAYCLTALASLDDQVRDLMLEDLLAHPSPQTRYGAFRAMRVRAERERRDPGELINESFWFHRVAPDSPPLIHITTTQRAELVLFGEDAFLQAPFSFLAGPEFTVTASQDDERCTITRFSPKHGTKRRQCGLKIEEVLRTMAELGAGYGDVVDLLRQADHCCCLTCKVAVDALPQVTSVFDLARSGATDLDLGGTDAAVLKARGELSATPTLFQTGRKPPQTPQRAGRE